jgi:Phage tail protein (Tail_P2_I)
MAFTGGIGFGHGPFGSGPFGSSDLAEQLIIKSFPAEYLEGDSENGNLLKHYLQTAKHSMDGVVSGIRAMDTLLDPLNVREDILRDLGSTIDIVIDDAEPKEYARSLVNNAVVYYQIKGTEKSYKIRGKISGFDVTVNNLYRFDYGLYGSILNPDDIYELPAGSNQFYTTVKPGAQPGLPLVGGCDYCLTSYIRIKFLVVKTLPPSTSINFFDRLIRKLKEITPIHVRDILYELSTEILIDEHQYLNLTKVTATEDYYIPMHVFNRYDAIPADMISTDFHGYVSGGF